MITFTFFEKGRFSSPHYLLIHLPLRMLLFLSLLLMVLLFPTPAFCCRRGRRAPGTLCASTLGAEVKRIVAFHQVAARSVAGFAHFVSIGNTVDAARETPPLRPLLLPLVLRIDPLACGRTPCLRMCLLYPLKCLIQRNMYYLRRFPLR